MSLLFRDVRFALRGLRKRPAFYSLIILTLALGIGVNVSIFSIVQALLLRPLPFADADRLVHVRAFKGGEPGYISQREIEELQRHSEVFEQVASYFHSQYNVTGGGAVEAAPCAINSHQLFEVLGARFAHGGPFAASEDFRRQYRVILQHSFWQRRYRADPDIVGKSIVLDGGSYVVDGVLAEDMDFPPGAQLYRQVTEYYGLDGRGHSVVARLRQGASLRQAQNELAQFSRRWQENHPATNGGVHFEAVPLRDAWVGAARPYLVLLSGGVGFVLLIAVFNVIHLLLSRASEREAEMAVRAALGASRSRLVRQLLAESVLLATLGGALGLALAAGWLRVLTGMVRADLPAWMEIRLDLKVFAVAAGLALLSGLLSGLVPALRGPRSGAGADLRAGARGTAGRGAVRLREGMVVGELALALVLLVGAGLMIRSFLALERQDLGFDEENLFTVRVDPPYWSYNQIEQLTPFYEQAVVNLQAIPGVLGVAANQNLPLAGLDESTKRIITLEGQSLEEQERNPFIHLQSVNPDYFKAMGIALRQGRAFTPDDHQDSRPVAVLGRDLAERLWPSGTALGQRLKLGPPDAEAPWWTVVGIAENVRSERRVGAASPDLYLSHFQHFTGDTYFALRTPLTGAELLRQVEAAIQSIDADLPLFDVAPMAERVAKAEWHRRVSGNLFVTFGLLALGLAAIGIYGVISQRVGQRTREMGIRLAIGARPKDLFASVMRQGLRLFLWGTAFGALASLTLARLVRGLLFGVEATDPWATLAAWAALLATAGAACLVPALKAARLDPVGAIRKES